MTPIRSLYVHFPFCETKCHYCDFYSLGRERTRAGDADAFEAALRREAELVVGGDSRLANEWDTIFFGGGTPSMTPPESMQRALEPLFGRVQATPATEWTMEANPSSIDLERLRAYRRLGVNRISMGVQAMRDELLLRLGRVHSRDKALAALEAIFEAGFDNVSVDLLCGVPGQTLGDLDEALTTLTRFPITHLSCYLLTLPKHHRMYGELPDEDEQLRHLLHLDQWMRGAGFEHYEISNYARPGRRARHNLAYWKGESYLALGPSAHGFDASTGRRWKNVSSLHKYAQLLGEGKLPVEWTEELTDEQRRLESWMLALRLDEGFPRDWLTTPMQASRARVLTEQGLLETHPEAADRLRLTARGLALSDQVIAALAG
jgi:oxygen-independent coproporphyrinogen-3 oxidase